MIDEKRKQYQDLYYEINKEQILSKARARYVKEKEKYNLRSREYNQKNKDKERERKLRYKKTPIGRFNICKNQANYRQIEFNLDFDFFISITAKPCVYCGGFSDEELLVNGLDRLDSTLGYININVVPCCSICNYMKLDLTHTEFIERIFKIANFIKDK